MKNTNDWLLYKRSRLPQILFFLLSKACLVNKGLLLIVLLHVASFSFSQTTASTDSTNEIEHLSSTITITNNGISLVPTFSLGKPAVIFNLSVGTSRLSFEPDLRVSLEGKPWSFVFWGRYKVITKKRFGLNVGAHPALNFISETFPVNGKAEEKIVARRFLAGEIVPYYLLTKNIRIGMYYLHGHGLESTTTRNLHFLTFNSNFSNINLIEKFYLQFSPQVFYLKMDKRDGFYFTSTLTMAKRNFPISMQYIINKTIQTDIAASKTLIWNASLIYSFNKEYVERKPTPL